MAKYIVRLTAEERMQLTELISTGRRAASVLARARILLKADASEGGPAWRALSQNNLSNFVYPVTFYTLGNIV
jgi:hypothetical protein